MLRILFGIICIMLLYISPSADARYLITWDDFQRTEDRCWNECTEQRWQTVIHCQVICSNARNMSPSFRLVPPSSREAAPSARGGDCVQECGEEQRLVCVTYEQRCGTFRVHLPDGDIIDVTIIGPSASGLPNNIIEVVLESGPQVTWWKAISFHAQRTDTEIWNQDNIKSASTRFDADEFRNGLWIEFKKAKSLGIHTGMYDLKQLDRIEPGSRVTFSWVKD